MVRPGGRDHAGLAVLRRPGGVGDEIAHAVDHADGKLRRAVGADSDGLLGDKFRLSGHNRLAGAALGQLILGPLASIGVVDIGQNQLL